MSDTTLFIFDLDGTIVDTLPDIANAMNTILTKYDDLPFEHSHYRSLIGKGTMNMARCSISAKNQHRLTRMHDEFEALYTETVLDKTRPYDGIKRILSLISESEHRLAVLSNKIDPLVQTLIHTFFSDIKFDAVVGLKQGVPAKPDPTSLKAMASEFSANKVYLIGDTPTDIETAIRGKAIPIAITWGYRDRPLLEKSSASLIIDSMSELEHWAHYCIHKNETELVI